MSSPVTKTILHTGQKYVPIADGSRVHFHFQTWKLGKERVLIDDNRKIGKKEPMMLIIGRKFRMEVWETIVKTMALGEVASFVVKKEYLHTYPFVSKTLREAGQIIKREHICTMTAHSHGIGHSDLDELMRRPCDLEFIIEMLKIEKKNEYEKDIWELNDEEKFERIPELKERGNELYGKNMYDEAENAYAQAIAICDQLLLRERKIDEEWTFLNNLKLPILNNYIQCKLIKGDFYTVIQYCNTILEHDTENEKALYRRAKAHVGAWNPDQAEADFKKLIIINPSMRPIVEKELENIKRLRKEKTKQDKEKLKNLFATLSLKSE